jgi:GT2 family glycosyltransferase
MTTVVISLNRRDDLLRSLPRHRGPVILVDNGSTDGTAGAVRAACPHVEIVELPANHGASARNVGVVRARTPYVRFADDDSWWAFDAGDRLVRLFDDHPRLGLVAARILVGPEERLDPASAEMADSPLPTADGVPGIPVLGFVACGAAVRRDAFLGVGGFDRVVFFPGEEERVAVDLAAEGWQLSYVPDVVAHHHPSTSRSTSSARERLIVRNSLLTAVMRRPWREVGRRLGVAVSSGPTGRSAVLAAVPRLVAALGERRRLPGAVEGQLELLSNS